jgi:hypothetical protein
MEKRLEKDRSNIQLDRVGNTRKGYEDLKCDCDWHILPWELRAKEEEEDCW